MTTAALGSQVATALAGAGERCLADPALRHTATLLAGLAGEEVAALDLHGHGLDVPVPTIASVTKSVLSTVTGWALEEGLVGLGTTLHELLGDAVPPSRRPATVHHALTMTSGAAGGLLAIDDVMELAGGWVDELLQAEQLDVPGSRFRYDNGVAHLLAAGLQRAVGGDLLGYARPVLAATGCADIDWPRDPDGVPYGFGDARLTPRQLLSFGQAWLGGSAVPGWYRELAWTPHTAGGSPEHRAYGYCWWIGETAGLPSHLAAGWAGQAVLVVPALRLTLVATGCPDGWREGSSRSALAELEAVVGAVVGHVPPAGAAVPHRITPRPRDVGRT